MPPDEQSAGSQHKALSLTFDCRIFSTTAQAEALLTFGCDLTQGYFRARPLGADAIHQLVLAAAENRPTQTGCDHHMTPAQIALPLVDTLIARLTSTRDPVFVAIDGRSGAGKSALAGAVAQACKALNVTVTVIEGDDFYAGGTAERWDQRSPADKAFHVIDWRRQHRVLEDLRPNGKAKWYPFHWESPDWNSEPVPLRPTPAKAPAANIVILEGAYSARPELHDIVDVRVLLDTPPERRRRQLLERESEEYRSDWEGRWLAAEDHYFGPVSRSVSR